MSTFHLEHWLTLMLSAKAPVARCARKPPTLRVNPVRIPMSPSVSPPILCRCFIAMAWRSISTPSPPISEPGCRRLTHAAAHGASTRACSMPRSSNVTPAPPSGAGRRYRITDVRRHLLLGEPETFRQGLVTHGFSGRVQTAFIGRLNLTVRRSLASLARRSWCTAHYT